LAFQRTNELLRKVPQIRETLKTDIQAAYDGDPAAKSFEEVVISYPYIDAITIHRIAHELYLMDVPLIPRMMSEYAHSKTGIDIHPGAEISEYFFIDHGTGVVIGETAVIGKRVKIYQGVTLGALSFPKDERGQIIRDKKRHPTLEDDVTVYAEATILGDITIGKGAVVGGNVWIRESVPSGTVVAISKPEALYKKKGPGFDERLEYHL
jgi:serine O-acetyltransferase